MYDSVSEKGIFLVNAIGKIPKPKILSKYFGITMRNLNDNEILSLSAFINQDLSKLFEISNNKRLLENKITVENASEISHKLINKAFNDRKKGINVNEDKLNAKLDKIFKIRDLKEIIEICDRDEKIKIQEIGISKIDYYVLAYCYSQVFLKKLIIIEYKPSDNMKKMIIDFNSAELVEEEVKENLFNNLLSDFIELYNILHFPQKDYMGISIKKINKFHEFYQTLLSPFHYEQKNFSEDWTSLFYESLNMPQYVDNYISANDNKIKSILFLLEGFRINSQNHRLECINYISSLEFLLTHKPKTENDSIISQLKNKVKYCYDKLGFDSNEINKIISYNYNYRSDILHGNFNNVNRDLKKLSKLSDIIDHLRLYKSDNIDIYDTQNNNILYANSILLKKIFKNIFIYLSNNSSKIDTIKQQKAEQ